MRKTTTVAALAGIGLAIGFATTADAHHAVNAQFDVTKSMVITGVLTKVDWQNPHAWFHFDVTKPDGTVEKWATETIGPNGLRRLGLSDRRLFTIGDTYQVELNPDRSGKFLGFTNAFRFPDGKYVKIGFVDAQGNGVAPPDAGAPAKTQ
jgi:hypothetical protein